MTPDEHAGKADDYLRGAAQLRRDYLRLTGATLHRAGPEGTELLAEAQLLATLAAAHATLSQRRPSPAGPPHAPPAAGYSVTPASDGHVSAGIVPPGSDPGDPGPGYAGTGVFPPDDEYPYR